jgi:hypothetical protein
MLDKDPKKRINIDDVDKDIRKINFDITTLDKRGALYNGLY